MSVEPGTALHTPEPQRRTRNPVTWILMGLVKAYQAVVSPWFPRRCRYHPSCSAYALTALRVHGPVRGTGLAAWRVLRCNPWSLGGVDYVPARAGSGSGSDSASAKVGGADPRQSQDAARASIKP